MDKDIALMAHLMRRAGFGASRDELEETGGQEATRPPSRSFWNRKSTASHPSMRGFSIDTSKGFGIPGNPLNMQSNWMFRMINSPRPLEEKMVLFWHHVFATGYSKVDNGNQMLAQIETFRRYALGNYRDILVELSKDPAMIFWLDNNENHKHAPNENWGRELLELFSMGQGNYTEEDVKECARAFTGWTISNRLPRNPYGRFLWEFEYREDDHDDTEKVFLGTAGPVQRRGHHRHRDSTACNGPVCCSSSLQLLRRRRSPGSQLAGRGPTRPRGCQHHRGRLHKLRLRHAIHPQDAVQLGLL